METGTITLILSIFGVVCGMIGTITAVTVLVINLRVHARDRPILHVTAVLLRTHINLEEEHLRLDINVVNAGRRIIRIVRAGLYLPPIPSEYGKKGFLKCEHFFFGAENASEAVSLEENQGHMFTEEPFDIDLAKSLGKGGTAFVDDTTGRRYKAPFFIGDTPDAVVEMNQFLLGLRQQREASRKDARSKTKK
jgi:hypothetical protein